jgi:hypothetical protein
MPRGIRKSDGRNGGPDDAQTAPVRRGQRRSRPPMTVAVAVERQTVEERSSYRLAVRALLADIIDTCKDRGRGE